MSSGVLKNISLDEKVNLFCNALGFEGLSEKDVLEIAQLSFIKAYSKGDIIFHQDEPCKFFYLVAGGLVKVYVYSFTGARITYLLAEKGEPINLVGPFTGEPRSLYAEAIVDSSVALIDRGHFVEFAFRHPVIIKNIISILGKAVDSANSRIIDMMEKSVKQRLMRVLYTLYRKFGPRIELTSYELADLAGTTTETTLRVISQLKKAGIINSKRGMVDILKPDELKPECEEEKEFWL